MHKKILLLSDICDPWLKKINVGYAHQISTEILSIDERCVRGKITIRGLIC